MGWWSTQVLPRAIDVTLDTAYLRGLREQVCSHARGEVLELGFGSGLNLAHYPPSVTAVLAVEPSDVAWGRSAERREAVPFDVRRVGLDGAHVALPDASVDTAVSVFTLCTIGDVAAAVRELFRVLRPGGSLLLLEHGIAPDQRVARWQHRLDPLQQRLAGGCHLTREPAALARAGGLVVDDVERFYLPGPAFARPWGYLTRARASRPG
ncbi:MAG TPA: class I SAM-dependent methyltransferase [Intrasporangium sp.]|uniref:class I SAM-dependent methyltransferase n=1 Tax=Intrasporangium sp. TaxID=1925024 RepID=UPI002D792BBF|nr:class I SAM-dependent methyltransferase [Intrasporangium sp.]HET7399694.1 class I SAM-dependent methyltransferase [Intrasporangium sp.]